MFPFSQQVSMSTFGVLVGLRLAIWALLAVSVRSGAAVTIFGNEPKLGNLGLEVFGYDGRHLYE